MSLLAGLTGAAAVVMAIANLIEDGVNVQAFGQVFVVAALALLAGLVALAALLALRRPRWLGLVPLATGVGIGAIEIGGGFLIIAAWFAVVFALRRPVLRPVVASSAD